jgi:hypothetical protein
LYHRVYIIIIIIVMGVNNNNNRAASRAAARRSRAAHKAALEDGDAEEEKLTRMATACSTEAEKTRALDLKTMMDRTKRVIATGSDDKLRDLLEKMRTQPAPPAHLNGRESFDHVLAEAKRAQRNEMGEEEWERMKRRPDDDEDMIKLKKDAKFRELNAYTFNPTDDSDTRSKKFDNVFITLKIATALETEEATQKEDIRRAEAIRAIDEAAEVAQRESAAEYAAEQKAASAAEKEAAAVKRRSAAAKRRVRSDRIETTRSQAAAAQKAASAMAATVARMEAVD